MKALLINQSDIQGGAAIAGFRLAQGLLKQGVDVNLLVDHKNTDFKFVISGSSISLVERLLARITARIGLNNLNVLNSFSIKTKSIFKEADILNFHNLHGGYFNYLAVPSLTKLKTAVFTLHDMWSFTGHCAYSYDCEKWLTGCGNCPYPESYPRISMDNTSIEWKLKKWVYSRSRLQIVSPSKWLADQAKQSMLNRFPIHHIPNGLDTQAYAPLEKQMCRSVLSIPVDSKVLMFGAPSFYDQRKGSDLLLKALTSLPASLKKETVLITIGDGGENISKDTGLKTLNLGYVGNDRLKTIGYSAADIFVFPTRADNLPIVLQESLACGTPMVSFNVGGVPDIVRPDITGYLSDPGDVENLSNCIIRLLEHDVIRKRMSIACREIAVKEYSLELQVKRYSDLFHNILNNTDISCPV